MKGLVVSTKMQKTATVLVENKKIHPIYGKSFIRHKKYLAEDLLGVSIGDIVEIEKIRPVSKRKHWRIIKVIGKNMEEIIEEQLKEEAEEAIEEVVPARLAEAPAKRAGKQVMPEEKEENDGTTP